MNVALEAITRFWHDDPRYDGKVFRLDLGDGTAGLTGFSRNPDCPGPHERLPECVRVWLAPDATATDVLDLARSDGLTYPRLELSSPFAVALPCRVCGGDVNVGRPSWAVQSAPTCEGGCGKVCRHSGALIKESVARGDALATLPLSTLGLGPLGLCIVEDDVTGELRAYELPGSIEDVLNRISRSER